MSQWAANAAKTGLQLVMLPVMARTLNPVDFGVYAVALPVVTFFVAFADSGIGLSLAKEDEAHTLVWSTAYWTVLGSFCTLALFVAGSGPVLFHFTGRGEYMLLMPLLAIALPLMAVTITSDARITRRGNLHLHSIADIVGSFVAAAVGITLALRGWGVWSLAAQYVTIFAVRAVLYNAVVRTPPRFEYDLSTLRGHVGTSTSILTRRIGDLVARSAETAMFQTGLGAIALGSYTLAMQVTRFGCEAITNPLIGALYTHVIPLDENGAKRAHGRILSLASMLLLPGVAIGVVCGPRILPIVLGAKWSAASNMLPPLLATYAISALSGLVDPLLMRYRRTGISTAVVIGGALARVGAVALGSRLGLMPTIWALSTVSLIQALTLVAWTPRAFGGGIGAAVVAMRAPTLAAICGGVAAAAVLACGPSLVVTSAAVAAGLGAYGLLLPLLDPSVFALFGSGAWRRLVRRSPDEAATRRGGR